MRREHGIIEFLQLAESLLDCGMSEHEIGRVVKTRGSVEKYPKKQSTHFCHDGASRS